MNDSIISVNNLGKKYRIQHQQERQRYVALRDVIAAKFGAPMRWLRSQVRRQKSTTLRSLPSDLGPPTSGSASQEDFWALHDLSFEIKQGEDVGVRGRNGAEKST